MSQATTETATTTLSRERADLLETLATHQFFLKNTLRGLTDEQAALTPTASELCLGGLVKHVADMERQWADFIVRGGEAMAGPDDEAAMIAWAGNFKMLPGDTVEGVLARYEEVAAITDALVRDLPDLDADQELPPAPWFEPGARRSARRVFVHIVAETAQHAGHADIIRETIDGAKSMG